MISTRSRYRTKLCSLSLPLSLLLSLLLYLSICITAHAQSNPSAVNQSDGPPSGLAMQTVVVYNGLNVIGLCYSQSTASSTNMGGMAPRPRTAQITVSAISSAAAAVVTSTGHGLTVGTYPSVTISGVTGAGGWTAANASWTATVLTANTFSIPLNSSAYTGSAGGTMVFTTTAPRQTVAEWAVQAFGYQCTSGTGLTCAGGTQGTVPVWKGWLSGSQAFGSKCSDLTGGLVVIQ